MKPVHIEGLNAYLPKYDYTVGLRRRDWAWEFLRRNMEFQRQAHPKWKTQVSCIRATENITLLKPRRAQPLADNWGLLFFPNPHVSAPLANVFWKHDLEPNQLLVQVIPRLPTEIDAIFERSLRTCKIKHLTHINGSEHILLNGQNCSMQAQTSGHSLISGEPVRMSITMKGAYDLKSHVESHQRSELVFEPRFQAPLPWSGRSRRLRNALVCLDVKTAGMDLRHAGEIIFGEARIARDWNTSKTLRDRLRSYYRTGLRLRDGGYKRLLTDSAG